MDGTGRPAGMVDVLEAIYESAFDRTAFERLSGLLAKATDSANAVLVLRGPEGVVDLSTTSSLESQQAYMAYYGQIDIWARITLRAPPMTISASEDFVSDAEVLNSEFYADYARHLDIFHPMGVTAHICPDLTLSIGLNRARAAPRYDGAEKALLLQLTRHMQRAMQLRSRLQRSDELVDLGHAALNALSFGAIIANGEGHAILSNSAAERLHKSAAGIVLRGGRVAAALFSDAMQLSRLIADAARGGAGGAMRLRQADGAASLLVLVSPLPGRLSDTGAGAGFALVAIARADDSPGFVQNMLRGMFGLSAAEARIALALMEGQSLEAIALSRRVKISTLRTQLESIFRKTGAESQRDLMRLLGRLPQVRGAAGS